MGSLENLEPTKTRVEQELEQHPESSKDEPAVASLVQEAFGRPGAEAPKAQQAQTGDRPIKPHVDHESISGLFSAIGTVLTHPVQAVTSGLSNLFVVAQGARELAKTVTNLASPAGLSGLALTKVDANKWQSSDRTVAIEAKSDMRHDKTAQDLSSYLDLFDKQVESGEIRLGARHESKKESAETGSVLDAIELLTPKSGAPRQIDLNSDIYTEGSQPSDQTEKKSNSYVNARGENATVTVDNDSVHFTAKKDGETITDAWQLNGLASITHRGENATLNTKIGELNVTSDQLKILQRDGRQEVELPDGSRVEKAADGKIKIYNTVGLLLQSLTPGGMFVENDVALVQNADLEAAARNLGAARVKLVLDTETGHAFAQLPNGLTIAIDDKKNAVIKAETGEVILVANDGKVYILQDGKYVKLPCEKTRMGNIDIDEHGHITFKDLKIGGQSISTDGFDLDLARQQLRYRNGERGRNVHYGQLGNGVELETDELLIKALGSSVSSTTKPPEGRPAQQWSMNLSTNTFETRELSITPTETRIRHLDGRADTVIKPDNTVIFDNGNGPILHNNGGIHFDERTHVDARGNVTSGDWHASAGYAGANKNDQANNPAGIEGAAAQAASHGSSKAMSIYGKASSGMVTMSDIDALSQNLSDVTALIAQLAAAGRMDLVGQLQSTCGMIMQTINFALPKAQAAQAATQQGLATPSQAKEVEEKASGRTFEQAAELVRKQSAA